MVLLSLHLLVIFSYNFGVLQKVINSYYNLWHINYRYSVHIPFGEPDVCSWAKSSVSVSPKNAKWTPNVKVHNLENHWPEKKDVPVCCDNSLIPANACNEWLAKTITALYMNLSLWTDHYLSGGGNNEKKNRKKVPLLERQKMDLPKNTT